MKIYLDNCCLNRPFDDQTQIRIRLEAEAVLLVLAECVKGNWEWVGSEILDLEINRIPDAERKRRIQTIASHVNYLVVVGELETNRAQELETWSFSAFDTLHLACAESYGVDILLTVDDKFLKKAAGYGQQLRIRVENPLTWLKEVTND